MSLTAEVINDNLMLADEAMDHDFSFEMEVTERRKRKGKQEVCYEMLASQDEGGSQGGPSVRGGDKRARAKKKQRVVPDSCFVCLENYTQTRQKVACEKCEYHACQECVQKYLEQKQAEPHCMNCKEEFSM
eukprot:jgi/Picsp_1/2307/NSC_05771-R1_hypothetical protein BpV2_110c [Bathycoccus sp. RCC1105 virus BpV2]